MIDLRYHIVSIVSIFLALAVGILLGAGPLQEDLGKTLTSQVSTLRDEKADLRTQLTQAERRVEAGEEFATTVTGELVGDQLAGRSVVLVTLPGADNDAATALTEVLTAAGADVNGTIGITSAWTDAATASARADVAESLGPTSTADDSEPAEPDDRLAAALAGALLVPRVTDADKVTPATTQTLNGLKAGDLVTFDGEVPETSTLAVLVAPAPEVPPATEPTAQDRASADLAGWLGLARALDRAGNGAAVVGPPTSADTGGLIGAARQDGDTRRIVSTVDDLTAPMGRIAAVFALREQAEGAAGQYGLGTGAAAVLPTQPADAP